ncbi:hypothetical protein SDC9_03525 [bioreactor metagenome]|uniref:Uncharacterized protein n=1 Tax=bioreactor metagenome TaxID=1076179 RepID=A0A644STI5_9ZZZZ|nr:hypothetical protein [Methanobrevibacter sp.]MEA4956144.1 hypothetical protein [Methanobrevibacter sp.]
MKKSNLLLLIIIILIILGLIFILSDGSISMGEFLILGIGLLIGIFISDKIGE